LQLLSGCCGGNVEAESIVVVDELVVSGGEKHGLELHVKCAAVVAPLERL